MSYKILRPIAVIVLFFFSWTFLGIYNLAYAIDKQISQSALAANQPKKQRPEEKLQKGIEDIIQTIERVKKVKTHEELQGEKDNLRAKRQEIEGHDTEIKKQFAETEEKIKNLPDEIKQRHKDFVKRYEENLNILRRNLDEIEKAETKNEIDSVTEKIKAHLEKVRPPSRHTPLDPNKLPHRKAEPTKKKPRLKYDNQESGVKSYEFEVGSKEKADNSSPITHHASPILVASIGDLQGILTNASTQALPPPTQADLSETIEVQFTQEIRDLANQLQNNPVKIYEWVRNNIEFVPTYGSIQGADMCLQTKQCNAFDTASLLIALLRTSNIPAKYVYGTIEIPIDKVMNWVGGFTDANSALDFIASGGIPVSGLISGGKISAARMEHVWVEAWIDYIPSRGAIHKQGDTWIPLDASYKQYNYKIGVDLYSSLAFNGDQFMNRYITDTNDITPYQHYGKEMFTWLDNNMPNAGIEEVLGAQDIPSTKVIIQQTFPFLLGTLPYKIVAQGSKYSYIPDSLRHKVIFEIAEDIFGGGIAITKSLPELSGKRLTLSYIPATSSDEALVAQYGGDILKVPPYLLNVKPVIKIDGINAAIGSSVGMASTQTLAMTFIIAGYGIDVVENKVIAGTYSAIIIQSQKNSVDIVAARMEKLRNNSKNVDAVTLDDLLGELLYNIGLSYFHHLTFESDLYVKTFQMVYVKYPSEAITTLDINISYLFGVPRSVSESGLNIDVDRDVYASASLTGDTSRTKEFMVAAGMTAAAWEHKIFEVFLNTPSVSAMKLLKYASQQGIPVYTIDSTNINQLLPTLSVSSTVKTEIQNAINAGKMVIVPQTELQYYEWRGVGYVVLDTATGIGAYMISGGMAGGGTAKVLTDPPIRMNKYSIQYQAIKAIFINSVVVASISFVGTGYVWGGKDPEAGFDCSGFTQFVIAMAGYKIPVGSANQYNYFKSNGMLFDTPQVADLFFYQKDGKIYHVGIVGGVINNTITIADAVTIDEKGNIIREVNVRNVDMNSTYWNSHIAGFGRVIE